jgi:hypothetical protein
MFNKNMYVQLAYQEYLDNLSKNKYKLQSAALSPRELSLLYNSNYGLTEFEIYLYIKVLDYLFINNKFNINLSSGLTEDSNKYKNILVDLYYQNISNEFIFNIPISNLFGFKYIDDKPQNLYKSYTGDYTTYKTFKELVKIYLDKITLYKYKGNIYNEFQLSEIYEFPNNLNKNYESNWFILSRYDSNLIKLEYKCLSVLDPKDISINNLGDIKINFILQNLDTIYDSFYIIDLRLKDF